MCFLVRFTAVGLLAVPFAPHAFDRPLADITVESRTTGVRISMMMNFQFIDSALGISGNEKSVPTGQEILAVRNRLRDLFESRKLTRIDGAAVTPLIKDFEISPPPKELRDREPQLARKLTQIRFALDYATDVKPKVVALRWSWFPEHPLYDVPDSPLAPMVVNAVVLRGSNTPDVLKFTTDTPGREIKFETPPTEVTRTSHPSSPNSSLLLLGGGLALMLLVFGSVVLPKRVRSGSS